MKKLIFLGSFISVFSVAIARADNRQFFYGTGFSEQDAIDNLRKNESSFVNDCEMVFGGVVLEGKIQTTEFDGGLWNATQTLTCVGITPLPKPTTKSE